MYVELIADEEEKSLIEKHGLKNVSLKLLKSIYGLKQAGRNFQQHFKAHLSNACGMTGLKSDSSVFFKATEKGILILLTNVDDMIAACTKGSNLIKDLKDDLKKAYGLKELGIPKLFLGMKVEHDKENKAFLLSQTHEIESIVKEYGRKTHFKSVPMKQDLKLFSSDEKCEGKVDFKKTNWSIAVYHEMYKTRHPFCPKSNR